MAGVARWDGAAWQAYGTADGTSVDSATAWDPDGSGPLPSVIVALGRFPGIVDGLVWGRDGDWSAFPVAIQQDSRFRSKVITFDHDGDPATPDWLLVCGRATAGGAEGIILAWNGARWSALLGVENGASDWVADLLPVPSSDPPGVRRSFVCTGSFNGTTIAGRYLGNAGIYDGDRWRPLGEGFPAGPSAACVFDLDNDPVTPPSLVVSGAFREVGPDAGPYLASWSDERWLSVTPAPSFPADSLAIWDADGLGGASPKLVTTMYDAPGSREFVGVRDSDSWRFLENGLFANSPAQRLTGVGVTLSNELIVSGSALGPGLLFSSARWSGEVWVSMPAASTRFRRFLVADVDGPGSLPPSLVAAGWPFSGSTTQVLRWDGLAWVPIGGIFRGDIRDLAFGDIDGEGPLPGVLVASGSFTAESGDTSKRRICYFSEGAWRRFGSSDVSGTVPITAMAFWDSDGDGPLPKRLVASGQMITGSGSVARGLAAWNDDHWIELVGGLTDKGNVVTGIGHATTLTAWDPDGAGPQPPRLAVGGSFGLAGGLPAGNFAWLLPADCCAADFNEDGFLDFFDYADFVECFEGGRCSRPLGADFNRDGFVDFLDYGSFVEVFESGC